MIKRYTLREMGHIWSDFNKYSIWLEIELLACEKMELLGLAPKGTSSRIREKATIDVSRIDEIELKTKHDVIAFLTSIEEQAGEDTRFLHLGMTSSDVLDTCFAVQCKQAGLAILSKLNELAEVLERKSYEHKNTLCIGRTHGIHAETTTFGLKLALWYDECKRNIFRLDNAIESISVGKINGAVGTYEHIDPEVEIYVCEKLGLKAAAISTQVIQRDRHAEFMFALAISASLLEKIATEVRHLQRTEVLEVEEFFSKGQKGSSAMPHKRNPIVSENICGQARLIRSNLFAAIENNTLWHERDISHSSVERVIFPDSTISLDYILTKTIDLIDNLLVYPEKMQENLNLTLGLIYSQKVLLELAKRGLKRQDAYVLVQTSAMKTWNERIKFIDTLMENKDLMQHISVEEIKELFNNEALFEKVNCIFKRVFNK